MKLNMKILLVIFFLILIGSFLRFYNIVRNPVSLNIDEVSYGYSAYSILKTGRDENGVFMPLVFRSTGDYKNSILIYSLVPSIAIFGLNEFGVRFTTAFFGILSIPALFLLITSLIKNRKIALLAAALLAVSPWHIYYSRLASESLIGLFFLISGMWLFLKMLKGSWRWAILASLVLTISIYSYHSLRLFTPIFIMCSIFIEFGRKKAGKKNLIYFTVLSVILSLPLLYLILEGSANVRASMTFLSQDIDYTRYIILDHIQRSGENFLLFFFWIKRFLNYFQPNFLFFSGLNMTTAATFGLGVLYLYELPWFILGIIGLVSKKIENKPLIVLWILLGIAPATLTNNEQSPVRSLIILPMLILVVAIGASSFFQIINRLKNRYLKLSVQLSYALFILIIFTQAFLIFVVHFPVQKGEAFMEGTKETVLYALANKEKYQEIVYDPYRGIEAPYIVNIPHMYFLFYSKYDPFTYQTIPKNFGQEFFNFDKFTIRRIDWRVDREKQGVLFIGSPWSLPRHDLKAGEILKEIYLSSGDLAFLIVSPSSSSNLEQGDKSN